MCVVVVFVPLPFATYGYSYFFYTVCIIGCCVRRFGILIVTRKFWFYKQSVRGRVYCVETRVSTSYRIRTARFRCACCSVDTQLGIEQVTSTYYLVGTWTANARASTASRQVSHNYFYYTYCTFKISY